MGANSSKEETISSSPTWNNQYGNQQPGYSEPYYVPESQYHHQPVQQPYPPTQTSTPTPTYAGPTHEHNKRFERMYSRIADEYSSLEQVTQALARAGLESSNLIVGVDFTKSNEWTGAKSFNKRSLHHIGGYGDGPNLYEQAISIIGKTLAAFDDDNLIPCYGFGDASTHDQDVFSFYPDKRICNGFEEVLSRYREIVPHLRLAGPTSFAPVIEMAMTVVERSGGQYHVLLIIADGQVTRSVDTEHGRLSPQEQRTVDAIVEASKYPLSIVVVGVGDGPWDTMKEFDDNIPARDFDNFQFVNFAEIMAKSTHPTRKETEFALAALMEVPLQYKATIELHLLGQRRGTSPERVPLPTPMYNAPSQINTAPSFNYPMPSDSTSFQSSAPSLNYSMPSHSTSFQSSAPSFNYSMPSHSTSFQSTAPHSAAPHYYENYSHASTAPPVPSSNYNSDPPDASSDYDNQLCPICLSNKKDMAFGCGHQTCAECGQDLLNCPICRSTIQTRIKLY